MTTVLLVLLGAFLWVFGFTLLGLVIALLTWSKPYAVRFPAVIFRASPLLRWFFVKAKFIPAAFTWGCAIFTWNDIQDGQADRFRAEWRALLRHELKHTEQALTFGLAFPFLYLGSMLVAWLNGGRAYADCYFEKQARKAEVEL
jgi:hypothetical protein